MAIRITSWSSNTAWWLIPRSQAVERVAVHSSGESDEESTAQCVHGTLDPKEDN
jgi:hypothetical protein